MLSNSQQALCNFLYDGELKDEALISLKALSSKNRASTYKQLSISNEDNVQCNENESNEDDAVPTVLDEQSGRSRKRKGLVSPQALAEGCFRQMEEFIISRELEKAFSFYYPCGFDGQTISFKKITSLRHKLLRSSKFHVLLMASEFIYGIKTTLWSRVPYSVFASFLIVLCKHKEACSVTFWENEDNREQLSTIFWKFWPAATSRTERRVLKAGLSFFQKVFMVLIDMEKTGFDGNLSELSLLSDVEEAKNNIRDCTTTLREGDANNHRNVEYWTKSEAEDFCKLVEKLNSATSSYLENVTAQAFPIGKVVQYADKKKAIPTKLNREKLRATTFCYLDESAVFLSPTVYQFILCTLVSTLLSLMLWFNKLRSSDVLTDYLKRLGSMNGSKATASSKNEVFYAFAPEMAEIIRTTLLFHDSAMPLAFLTNKKEIMLEFLMRIGEDGTIINKDPDFNVANTLRRLKCANDCDELKALFKS